MLRSGEFWCFGLVLGALDVNWLCLCFTAIDFPFSFFSLNVFLEHECGVCCRVLYVQSS